MPIPQTIRVNPLDLQKNIVIGVSLPFNAAGVFNKTYSTKDQIKSNLINLLLTDKGERIMNPEFGADILRFKIIDAISIFIPEIVLGDIEILPDPDANTLSITINYRLIISNTPDQVTVQFQ